MEPVNELDIDGYRWEIKDLQARQDISALKSNQEQIVLGNLNIPLEQGFTADSAKLVNVCRQGKMVFGTIHFVNLAGEKIGTRNIISIAKIPLDPLRYSECVAVDMFTNNAYRIQIFPSKTITIISTENLKNGDSELSANFIFFEK